MSIISSFKRPTTDPPPPPLPQCPPPNVIDDSSFKSYPTSLSNIDTYEVMSATVIQAEDEYLMPNSTISHHHQSYRNKCEPTFNSEYIHNNPSSSDSGSIISSMLYPYPHNTIIIKVDNDNNRADDL